MKKLYVNEQLNEKLTIKNMVRYINDNFYNL